MKKNKDEKIKKIKKSKKASVDSTIEPINELDAKSKRKANIITWCVIGSTGLLTGGGVGGFIAKNIIDDRKASLEEELPPEDAGALQGELDKALAHYDEWTASHDANEDLSTEFKPIELLQIAFDKLEKETKYVVEGYGTLYSGEGLTRQVQCINSAKGRLDDLYYNESLTYTTEESKSPVSVINGTRFLSDGSNIKKYFSDKNLNLVNDKFIRAAYGGIKEEIMSVEDYNAALGAAIDDPFIYTLKNDYVLTDKPNTIQKGSDNTYTVTVSFNDASCRYYKKQIKTTGGKMLKKVGKFDYTSWVFTLDSNLLPLSFDLTEEYDIFAKIVNDQHCNNHMTYKYYYGEKVNFPELSQPYAFISEGGN